MLQTLKNRMAKAEEGDKGFTLIELMVVVMIIAVLLAIAVPMFLGSKNKAEDRSAQSSLHNTAIAAKSIYTDSSTYAVPGATGLVDTLTSGEPSLTFVAGTVNSANPKTVSVSSTASVFVAAAASKSGDCFYVKDDLTSGAAVPGTSYAKVAKAATCNAGSLTGVTFAANGWS